MQCSNCGYKLKDQYVKFCPKCGTKLQAETIAKEIRLQRALVSDLDLDKTKSDKNYISFTVNNNVIDLDYAKSMYVNIRKPMEGYRSTWKYRLLNTFKQNRRTNKNRSYTDFKNETVKYYEEEKDRFINEVLNHINSQINRWPAFVRDNYREAIEERINYNELKKLIKKLEWNERQKYFEEIATGMKTPFESKKHSKAFQSYGGFGIINSVLGTVAAEAANYTVDVLGAAIEYTGHVKQNIDAKKFLNGSVPFIEISMVESCDSAANIVLNYCLSHLMSLCKLPSIDSTISIEKDDFNRIVLTNSKTLMAEDEFIKNACSILSKNPYDLSVIRWLYSIDPMLDEDILNYSKILGIQDVIENLMDDVERLIYHDSCSNPFERNYDIYHTI